MFLFQSRRLSLNMGVCKICKKEVSQVTRHFARIHQRKFWGFKCPVCTVIHSKQDSSFMRKHLASHGQGLQLLSCRVILPEGYVMLKDCPLCEVKTFTEEDMSVHFFDVHPPKWASESLEDLLDNIASVERFEKYPSFQNISPPSSPQV